MTKTKQRKGARAIAWLCALVYFISYVLRKNLGVMLVKVCSDMGKPESALAIVLMGLTVCYGGGQLISGMLGDKLSPTHMIGGGLLLAAFSNAAVYFATEIPLLTVLWCINGFAHSMIWAPMVKLFSTCLAEGEYSYAMMRVMWGSSFATVFLRLFCPAMLLVTSWRVIMLICAALGAAVALIFLLLKRRVFVAMDKTGTVQNEASAVQSAAVPLPRFAVPTVLLIVAAIVMHGALREGVDIWMPSFLCETFGMPEENAIFSTVILSVFGLLSFTVFDWLYRRVFHSELSCSAFCFLVAAVAAALLYLLTFLKAPAVLSMLLMALIIAAMSGANLMLVATVPKRFVKSGKVSTFTGLLDAAAYVGAAGATYGFAALFERFGWSVTILTWAIVGAAGLALSFACLPLWKKFRREYADT